jgi:capsule polysaccharide export protein KpsC/LpsZ
MIDTIDVVKNITNVQWVIKVHPAEARFDQKYGMENLIKSYLPVLPNHIRVLAAEEDINPLDFFDTIDGLVTIFGTSGLELAIKGKPVVLAGEAHYGRKGFTYDADSQEHYHDLLRQVSEIPVLTATQTKMARKYAYCYFIQKQIPLDVVKDPISKWWKFQFNKRELLLEGEDLVVDFICERIVDGNDFIMDDKLSLLGSKSMEGRT